MRRHDHQYQQNTVLFIICLSLSSLLLPLTSSQSAPPLNTWQDQAPQVSSQSFRELHVAANINNNMLVFGGCGTTNFSEALGDTWMYHYDYNTWTLLQSPSSPAARLAPAATSFSNNTLLFLFGGLSGPM